MSRVSVSLCILAAVVAALTADSSMSAKAAEPAPSAGPSPPVERACLLTLPDRAMAYFPAASRRAPEPPPLIVLLHGGGGNPREIIERFAAEADARDLVLLAPASKRSTWDSVRRAYKVRMRDSSGRLDGFYEFKETGDSLRVKAAIADLSRHVAVDRERAVLAGFSDGAGFALALGLSSDHPFAAVMAFSPGVSIPAGKSARGRVALVSHGRSDKILSYDFTYEVILPELARQDAEVIFRPFDGGHDIPHQVLTEFLDHIFGRRHRPLKPRNTTPFANCAQQG